MLLIFLATSCLMLSGAHHFAGGLGGGKIEKNGNCQFAKFGK